MKNLLLIFTLLALSVNLLGQGTSAYYCPPCNLACDALSFVEAGDCSHCGMQLLLQTPEERKRSMKISETRIGFYLQDGVEVLDFAGPMEVFAYAGFKIVTIAKTKVPIKSQGVLTILPDYSIADAPQIDVLAFFGGNGVNASSDPEVLEWIGAQKNIEYHFSVCTGAFFLAKSGILDGLTATTFHTAIDHLAEIAPNTTVLSDARWVDNGNVITTAGVSAGIDGALHFVRKLAGLEAAKRVAQYMEYDKWDPSEGVDTGE